MWGSIVTEANTLTNFNFGFSTHKSDTLIHLSQWQYWWWFWFSLFWALYFFLILRLMTRRVMHFNPVMNTSVRGHGKWGDFLVALIPLSWCGNILVNSNFILRMIEWQNESSLFTIRVQGKQWYWVYKFDATAAHNIMAAPKNIGNNRWVVITPAESYCADTYYQALNLGTQLEYKTLYNKFVSDQFENTKLQQATRVKFLEKQPLLTTPLVNTTLTVTIPSKLYETFLTKRLKFNTDYRSGLSTNTTYTNIKQTAKTTYLKISPRNSKVLFTSWYNTSKISQYADITTNLNFFNVVYSENSTLQGGHHDTILDDTTNVASNALEQTKTQPLFFARGALNKHVIEMITGQTNKNLLLFTLHENFSSGLEEKTPDNELVWGFKQKKYKRLQKLCFTNPVSYDPKTLLPIKTSAVSHARTLKSQLIKPLSVITDDKTEFNYHRSIKLNRHRAELVPVNLARRLLRTKRTLVLPAHVNLTVITNSYDVVHSWFIPGLGLKMDCVPGRSTHHSFYIDNIGFYYGQCAEICGRYHHHMPIRICALSFEHFLVWWNKKGLRRMHRVGRLQTPEIVNSALIIRRAVW